MGIQSTAGSVTVAGTTYAVAAASVTIAGAQASDRRDIIVANSSGSVYAVQGTPCGTAGWTRNSFPGLPPVKPAIPANNVFLSEIYVGAATTSIQSGNIENNTTIITPNPAAGVSSFNTRTGPVTLNATDVEKIFTTPGQLIVGTGSTTGELLTAGSVGTVLTSNGAASIPSWKPASGGGGTASVTVASIEQTFSVAGQIYVGTGAGTGTQLAVGSVGTVLLSNGTGTTPSWQPAGTGGNMNTSTYDPAGVGQQLVGITATQTLTNKTITRRWLQTSAPGATPSLNTNNYDGATFSALAANITSMSTNLTGSPVVGQLIEIVFVDNGTARTITWGASFASTSVVLPTTTIASQPLNVLLQYQGSVFYCIAVA